MSTPASLGVDSGGRGGNESQGHRHKGQSKNRKRRHHHHDGDDGDDAAGDRTRTVGVASTQKISRPRSDSQGSANKMEEIVRRETEKMTAQLSRYLTEDEKTLLQNLVAEIDLFQHGDNEWLGNFVQRIRRRLGNPLDSVLRHFSLPLAEEILRQAAEIRVVEGFSLGEDGLDPTLTLEDALDGALRFLLSNRLDGAKHLLTIAIALYPTDLRLYKMYAFVIFNDRTLNWRDVRLQELLSLLDGIKRPDAEIFALMGDAAQKIWRLDKVRLQTAELAVQYYSKCFHMWRKSKQKKLSFSAGYSLAHAALLCSELFGIVSRQGVQLIASARNFNEKAIKFLESLQQHLQQSRSSLDTPESERYYHYHNTFTLLGLGQYKEAAASAEIYATYLQSEQAFDDLAEETTRRELEQLVKIIIFWGLEVPERDLPVSEWHEAWQLLHRTFNEGARKVNLTRDVISGIVRGRTGIALSGGGNRAAWLHLGMFARLAECDVLRQVEAVSAVSGGSLIGALYYLKVKKLLEAHKDNDLGREDYIKLVEQMIEEYTEANEVDMHISTFLNPLENLRVGFVKNYHRVHSISEKFHERLFCPSGRDDCGRMTMRSMPITPLGWQRTSPFRPRQHNWRRSNRVPALYLNCTNLNTGHLWRFCVTYMGEKADMTGGDLGIDNNSILESVEYELAVKQEHKDISLSDAVAVSILVPAVISDPYPLDGLYPGISVRLVDGGIFDNAGLNSLYHALTDVIIYNEMGLALEDQTDDVPTNTVSVLSRVLDITLDLSYERLFRQLRDKAQSHGVKDVCFMFLRQHKELSREQREAIHYQRRVPALRDTDMYKEELGIAYRFKNFAALPDKASDKIAAVADKMKKKKRYGTLKRWQSWRQKSFRRTITGHSRSQYFGKDDEERESFFFNSEEEDEDDEDGDFAGSGLSGDEDERRRSLMPRQSRLSMLDLIRVNVGRTRSSIDHFTHVERTLLMSTGYQLTDESLRRSALTSSFGGFSVDDALHLTLARGSNILGAEESGADDDGDENESKQDEQGDKGSGAGAGARSGNVSATISLEPHQWQYFDVEAPAREWVFSSMLGLLEDTARIRVPHDRIEDQHGVALHDRYKLAKEVIRRYHVNEITQNPAIQSLFKQSSVASSHIAMFRAFRASTSAALVAVLVHVAVLMCILFFSISSFVDLVQDDIWLSDCLCLLEEPLYYIVLFVMIFVLLIQPGYLSRFLWAVFLGPLHAYLSVYVFDWILDYKGSVDDLLWAHSEYKRGVLEERKRRRVMALQEKQAQRARVSADLYDQELGSDAES